MTYAAIACIWISGFIHEMPTVFQTSPVVDCVCYGNMFLSSESLLVVGIYYFLLTYLCL